jgi:preprotein translocase subunit SecD
VTQSDRNKLFLTLIGLAAALFTLWPTFQFYAMSPAQRQEVLQARPATATNDAERVRLTKMATLRDKAIKLGLDLQGGLYLLLEVDRSKLGPAEAKGAVDQAMQIIRNRIDQFGVAEPSIQKQGENRILVQLPGLLDQERAKELIGQTALLDFKIVKTDDEARALFDASISTSRAKPPPRPEAVPTPPRIPGRRASYPWPRRASRSRFPRTSPRSIP